MSWGATMRPIPPLRGRASPWRPMRISILLLVGDEARLKSLMAHYGIRGELANRVEIVHAPSVVTMDDKATCILKDKKDSSIRIAAQLVRDGRADGIVSMGHTGRRHGGLQDGPGHPARRGPALPGLASCPT